MSHLEALSRVSFDLGVFARVARQRLRRTFVYLALLVLVASASSTTWVMLKLREGVRWLEPHLDEIPTITIRNGVASADVEQPWVKVLGEENGKKWVAIIDTTGTLEGFKPDEYGVFLKRTELLTKQENDERIIPLSRIPDTKIGPDIVREWIREGMRRAPFYVGAFMLIWYLFAKTMTALLLVLAGLTTGRSLRFGQLFTVAVYALTPAVILDAASPFLPFHIPAFWLVYWGLAITYAIVGARRAAETPTEPPATSATL